MPQTEIEEIAAGNRESGTRAAEAPGSLEYYLLDVFTENRLEGNQLAVVLNPSTLNTSAMQAIARETNLSETTFVERRSLPDDPEIERRDGVRVRIFTTQEELPFAGHPTLGTASLLRAIAPECVAEDTVRLALNVGTVPVRFEPGQPSWPARGTMTQRDPEFGAALDAAEVAALTGLAIEDFDPALPVQIVSTGTAFAIVPLRSAAALARLDVRQAEAKAYLNAHGARWFYVLGPESDPSLAGAPATRARASWRARMQFHGGEDPATGSAAGCAIAYLVGHGVVPSDQVLHVRQGVEILRPSDLYLSASVKNTGEPSANRAPLGKVANVRVGGSTVLVAKGRLFLR